MSKYHRFGGIVIKDNKEYNETVKANTMFINELETKLPEFFVNEKYDEEGNTVSPRYFDIEKFKEALIENNIEEIREGYNLSFIGKDYAKKQSGEKSMTVVVPDNVHNNKEINKNSKNLFFTGDNLEVLRHLQNNYQNSIDFIYIDPPYNTGNDGFVYPDSFEYTDKILQDIFGLNEQSLKKLKSIQGKSTHSAWLTFMYPRLFLAKRLLKESGIILISIDDNEQSNLKLLADEIYGENNFITKFIWEKTQHFGRQKANYYSNADYILAYAKNSISSGSLREVLVESIKTEFTDAPLYNGSNNISEIFFPKGTVKFNMKDQTISKTTDPKYQLMNPVIIQEGLNSNDFSLKFRSRWSNSTTQDEILKGTTFWVKTDNFAIRAIYHDDKQSLESPRQIIFTNQNNPSKTLTRFSERIGTSENASNYLNALIGDGVFSYPKPVSLLKYLISMYNNRGYPESMIVLDFFAGSATTADAVLSLNSIDGGDRTFIMAQLDEPTYEFDKFGNKVARENSKAAFDLGYLTIDEISRERIIRASKKIREEKDLLLTESFDGGFKHYRVVKPTQASINDLERFDIESGMFRDKTGNFFAVSESGFEDMIKPFSSDALGVEGDATGVDTILTTWMIRDGYTFDMEVNCIEIEGYPVFYFEESRIYLINPRWTSNQTRLLLNKIGKYELNVQTIVIYGYSFDLESIRELELGLRQLPSKVNLVRRY